MDGLLRDGIEDNHQRVHRIYTQERLQLGRRKRRQNARYRGSKLDELKGLNKLWTMDFVSDPWADGSVLHMSGGDGGATPGMLGLEADTLIGGQRAARVPIGSKSNGQNPQVVGTDNGPEFRS